MQKRILVVENDLLNRMFYSAVLEAEGFAVQLVDDGACVLQKVREFSPDLVTMDIQLPNVSGLELIRSMRKEAELSAIPVLAITAYDDPTEERRIRQAGANGFIGKPVKIEQLLTEIDKIIPYNQDIEPVTA